MKVKGIKKAVGCYNEWVRRNNSYRAQIMLDISTGEVWTDCFLSCNEWINYHSEDIISLSYYFPFYDVSKVSMDNIKSLIIKLMESGKL